MEDIIQYAVGFVVGMLVTTMTIRWMAQQAIARILDQINEEQEPEADNQLRVDVEFEQNIYFLYNSDDGSFVAQGNDLLDLQDNLRKRFPDRNITIVKGDATAMETLKKQLRDFDENNRSVGSTS
jgi:hypothetical protein